MCLRVKEHVVLGGDDPGRLVEITVDGKKIQAREGERILAALVANGIIINRYTVKRKEPRGLFCGIGQCTDCAMIVDGKPNVRTCITPVREGMVIETQHGDESRHGSLPGPLLRETGSADFGAGVG